MTLLIVNNHSSINSNYQTIINMAFRFFPTALTLYNILPYFRLYFTALFEKYYF